MSAELEKIEEEIDIYVKCLKLSTVFDLTKTTCYWDFNNALGDCISEKSESFLVKLREVSQVMIRKGAKGYFWIVGSPEVLEMFQRPSFVPNSEPHYMPMGFQFRQHVGTFERKWRLYADSEIACNTLLIGCGTKSIDKGESLAEFGVIKLANFII